MSDWTVGVVARNIAAAAQGLALVLDDLEPGLAGQAREIAHLVAAGEISPAAAMRLLAVLRMLADEVAPQALSCTRRNGEWDDRWYRAWDALARTASQAEREAWCVGYLAQMAADLAAVAAQVLVQREAARGAWLAMRGELLPPTLYERFDFDHEPDASASEASGPSMER